jgi:predicted DCC family thiol-disulfide oxidoreductase YuxK
MPEQATRILLFDGVCNLCSGSVLFVIKRDAKKQIRYASIQSIKGKMLLKQFHIHEAYLGSLIFIDEGKVYLKSTGALRLCKYLNGFWPILFSLILIPTPIRNFFYDWVAKNRYRWFGKNETCMVPKGALKYLFLDNDEKKQ